MQNGYSHWFQMKSGNSLSFDLCLTLTRPLSLKGPDDWHTRRESLLENGEQV